MKKEPTSLSISNNFVQIGTYAVYALTLISVLALF